MVARILTTFGMIAIAIAILKYTEVIVRNVGKSNLAERYLGLGGTYTMWKLIAIILIVASFFVLTGQLTFGAGAFK